MSEAGRRLLDDSEWIVESATLLATPDPTMLSCVSFMLDPDLQDRADALLEAGDDAGLIGGFLFDAVELEVRVDRAEALDFESWDDGFRRLAQRYAEVSGLAIEGQDIADLLGEFRVPIFESQPEISESIEKWGNRASAVVGAVGTVAAAGAGHAGAVLVLIAPPLGAAILIGTYGAIGGIALAGYLRRRHQAKENRRAAATAAARQQGIADAAAAARQAEIDHAAAMHARAEERQQAIKAKLAGRPRLVIRPGHGTDS